MVVVMVVVGRAVTMDVIGGDFVIIDAIVLKSVCSIDVFVHRFFLDVSFSSMSLTLGNVQVDYVCEHVHHWIQ